MINRHFSRQGPSLLISGGFLVAANLVPLAGALFFDWDVFSIVLVYWFENLVIGLITVLRILAIPPENRSESNRAAKAFTIPFFLVHYGGFCLGHLLFLTVVLRDDSDTETGVADTGTDMGLWVAIVALLVSHLYSFFTNYLGRDKHKSADITLQMFIPYPRVVLLHLAIIFGAIAIDHFDSPLFLLAILIVGKTALDLLIHCFAHGSREDRKSGN